MPPTSNTEEAEFEQFYEDIQDLLELTPPKAVFFIPVPCNEKDISWVFILEGLVCLHRTIQLHLFQHYWLGHRLGLLGY